MISRKKTRKRLIWITVLVLLAALLVYALFFRQAKAVYEEETAKTQDIVTYYSFSGNIEPGDTEVVTTTSPMKVKTIYVKEGDLVEEGDNIIAPKNGDKLEAGITGTVTDIFVEKDDTVGSGKDLFRIADYANPVVSIRVDEYDVGSLQAGMTATVYIHALDKTLQGTVTEIDQEATVEDSIAYYDAKVSVPQDGTLLMGMTAEVTVIKDKAEMATTLSVKAIQFDESSQPYVFCYSRGEEIVRQPLLLGINNGSIVQVVDGVKSGETVLIPKEDAVALMPFQAMRSR